MTNEEKPQISTTWLMFSIPRGERKLPQQKLIRNVHGDLSNMYPQKPHKYWGELPELRSCTPTTGRSDTNMLGHLSHKREAIKCSLINTTHLNQIIEGSVKYFFLYHLIISFNNSIKMFTNLSKFGCSNYFTITNKSL